MFFSAFLAMVLGAGTAEAHPGCTGVRRGLVASYNARGVPVCAAANGVVQYRWNAGCNRWVVPANPQIVSVPGVSVTLAGRTAALTVQTGVANTGCYQDFVQTDAWGQQYVVRQQVACATASVVVHPSVVVAPVRVRTVPVSTPVRTTPVRRTTTARRPPRRR